MAAKLALVALVTAAVLNGAAFAAQSSSCASAGACQSCSNANGCQACQGSGYILNSGTGKCDCAPGFMAMPSNTKTNTYITCKPCTGNSVSPGGGSGTAKCSPCSHSLANAPHSLCYINNTWPQASYDITNRRWNMEEKIITSKTASKLYKKWTFPTNADVKVTPSVYGNRVYFPANDGNMYALDKDTGKQIWNISVATMLRQGGVKVPQQNASMIHSRTTPSVYNGNRLIFGTFHEMGGYPYLVSIDFSGKTQWATLIETHPAAAITGSPTIYQGAAFVGMSSKEEDLAAMASYNCCSFRGSLSKVDLNTGKIVWKTYMAPPGWSGIAVWGTQPAIDEARGTVIIGTGNNYKWPQAVQQCLNNVNQSLPLATVVQAQVKCQNLVGGVNNFPDSMVALDLQSGAVRWAKRLDGPDAWTTACIKPGAPNNCPNYAGPDFDFAQMPMLITACRTPHGCKELVVAATKGAYVWALSAENGDLEWFKQVGPGGVSGGMMFGSASDNSRIYVANDNRPADAPRRISLKGLNPVNDPSGNFTTIGGFLTALDAFDGTIFWTFAEPTQNFTQAAVTVANDVVYYLSLNAQGSLYAVEAATGKLLATVDTGASIGIGCSVVNGTVYVGNGYADSNKGTPGTVFTAITVPSA